MDNRYFASCALIILLTAPLGCLYEAAEKPYIVEVELKDDSIHKPPPSAGKMLAGKNFKNTAFLDQDQLDGACGKPRALPETLKAPPDVNCKPTTIDSK